MIDSPHAVSPRRIPDTEGIEGDIRAQIEQLSYLPGSAAVAMKFIEIGKDPDAGVVEYDKIISSDTALSSKLLSLANSSWFGTRHEVTKVVRAINLLGINNVRTLAISYCMAGLYNRLKIPKEELSRYWQASLCKGVAAKTFADAVDPAISDEAFTAGLFQDMALPVMHFVAGPSLLAILHDRQLDAESQIAAERASLGMDHSEVGRLLAGRLELPEPYVDAIAFHHTNECLCKLVTPPTLAQAIQIAAVFPHLPELWHPGDVDRLTGLLEAHGGGRFTDRDAFLRAVQREFDELYRFFQSDGRAGVCLTDLVAEACTEIADSATTNFGQLSSLMAEVAQMGATVNELTARQQEIDDERRRDVLTVALNRTGFVHEATKAIHAARRYGEPWALLYFDIDQFKSTNDAYGHQFGDFVLRELSGRVMDQLRRGDIFGRMGGDEFVILLKNIDPADVRAVADAIMKAVRYGPYVKGKVALEKTISLGVLCVPPDRDNDGDVETFINEADALMYMAKRSGPGQIRMRNFAGATAT